MKQAIIYALISVLVIFCLASCGPSDTRQTDSQHSDSMAEIITKAEENGQKEGVTSLTGNIQITVERVEGE